MADREIFKENLNYYLKEQNKKQKELAEYVGAKTTTVSGWTRGISYPRADAMEKIAMFFGISTSRLVGNRNENEEDQVAIVIPDSQLFNKVMKYMPYEDYIMVIDAFRKAEKRMKEEGKD